MRQSSVLREMQPSSVHCYISQCNDAVVDALVDAIVWSIQRCCVCKATVGASVQSMRRLMQWLIRLRHQ